MSKYIFTSLVKGKRYEEEFEYLRKEINKLGVEHLRYTPAEFNFNEKVNAIRGIGSKVVLIDTDHVLTRDVHIKEADDIEEGIHVRYSRPYLVMDSIAEDIDINGYFDVLKDKYGSKCINFLDESIVIFNLDESKMKSFISNWDSLIELTKNNSPFRFSDRSSGALEGCLISIAAKEAGITIYESKPKKFFDTFHHYGPSKGHRIKVTPTVV